MARIRCRSRHLFPSRTLVLDNLGVCDRRLASTQPARRPSQIQDTRAVSKRSLVSQHFICHGSEDAFGPIMTRIDAIDLKVMARIDDDANLQAMQYGVMKGNLILSRGVIPSHSASAQPSRSISKCVLCLSVDLASVSVLLSLIQRGRYIYPAVLLVYFLLLISNNTANLASPYVFAAHPLLDYGLQLSSRSVHGTIPRK